MGEKKCFYHYNKVAIDKCDQCGKHICDECKQNYQRDRIDKSKPPIKKVLCPTCNLDKYNGTIFIVVSLTAFMILLNILSLLGGAIGFFTTLGVFGLVLVIGNIFYSISMKEQRKKAKKILDKALNDRFRDLKKRNVQKKLMGIPGKIITAVYCRFCGAPLPLGENTCDYCGMTWVWQ